MLSGFWPEPALVWFLIGLFCAILELSAPGVVVIFFTAGAWLVALFLLFIPLNLFFQITIFTVTSVVSLITLRKRFNLPTDDGKPDETDDFYGQVAVVETPVSRDNPGRVRFKGALWSAETESAAALEAGSRVRIVKKRSITLFVEPLT